jgi:hypothetical protein
MFIKFYKARALVRALIFENLTVDNPLTYPHSRAQKSDITLFQLGLLFGHGYINISQNKTNGRQRPQTDNIIRQQNTGY